MYLQPKIIPFPQSSAITANMFKCEDVGNNFWPRNVMWTSHTVVAVYSSPSYLYSVAVDCGVILQREECIYCWFTCYIIVLLIYCCVFFVYNSLPYILILCMCLMCFVYSISALILKFNDRHTSLACWIIKQTPLLSVRSAHSWWQVNYVRKLCQMLHYARLLCSCRTLSVCSFVT